MFSFRHHSGMYGDVRITDKRAAEILGVSLKTIKKYAANPSKADRCKMAYLEAVACRRILPSDWCLWVDGDSLHTGAYSFNKTELDSIGWLRETFFYQNEQVDGLENRIAELESQLKEQVDGLENRIAELESQLKDQAQKKAVMNLPSNVVLFKPR